MTFTTTQTQALSSQKYQRNPQASLWINYSRLMTPQVWSIFRRKKENNISLTKRRSLKSTKTQGRKDHQLSIGIIRSKDKMDPIMNHL